MSWQLAFPSDAVPEGGMKLHPVGKRTIGIFRNGGQLRAVLNFCPHAGAPVCHGKVEHPVFADTPGGPGRRSEDQLVIRCPWHHWEFDLDTGRSLCPISPRLKTYAVREEDGQIWVDIPGRP